MFKSIITPLSDFMNNLALFGKVKIQMQNVKNYSCNKCGLKLINYDLTKINEHRKLHNLSPITLHKSIISSSDIERFDRKKIKEDNKRKLIENRKKYKLGSKKSRKLNKLKNKIQELQIELTHLKKTNIKIISKNNRKPHPFYDSREWQEIRFFVFKRDGRRCVLCGQYGGELHVDHIIPRSIRPDLELEPTNLQVLCRACNLGKSNKDQTDFRKKTDYIIKKVIKNEVPV